MKLIGIALLLLGLQQTLRVDVSVVTVGVRVTDSRGHDVRDLKAEDFREFDDEVKLAADLTTDRQKVTAAIQKTVPDGGTSLYDAAITGIGQTGRAKLARQVLVIISDGADQHSTH